MKIKIDTDYYGRWYWFLAWRDNNGHHVTDGDNTYSRKHDAKRAARRFALAVYRSANRA